jgi:P-type Ca2+ transporter type 2C
MGLIAGALAETPSEDTPLQKELARVGKLLGLLVVVIAVVMIATIIVVEEVRDFSALFEVLMLGVALAVAAVPEGLPAVVTAVLSIGVQRMAKRNAVVRNLSAVEALGSASVIASDKTGTLTKNEMTAQVLVTASGRVRFAGIGYQPEGAVTRDDGGPIEGLLRLELERALTVAERANNAGVQQNDDRWMAQGDPTEAALIVAARKAGLERSVLDGKLERVGEVPFSSERKLMSTVHDDRERGQLLVFTKGAPDVLLARCDRELVGGEERPLTEARRTEIAHANDALAEEALRTLAVAYRTLPAKTLAPDGIDAQLERELVFAGLIGIIDPPREEARDAVLRARGAGIRPVMITGDHRITASVIAAELGISSDRRAVTGAELAKMSDDALAKVVQEVSVYARVNPEHKLRIVRALKQGGAIVAMTGDGVNDAPALKTADIGVAMGITGTDVSKEAADIVLADDNFASIVAAVEEGRAVFANIRKFLRYLLSSNMGEVLTMFFGVVLVDVLGVKSGTDAIVLPVVATQLLWINLLTDGAPALALGVDPADPSLMTAPPRPTGERVITLRMWLGIALVGVVTAIGTLLVFDSCLRGGLIDGMGDLRYGQTMAFTTLVFFSLFTTFTARADEQSAFHQLFTNRWLWGALALSLALQVAVVYMPALQVAFGTTDLSLADWSRCAMVGSSVLWVSELRKWFLRRHAVPAVQPVVLHHPGARRG